jgi:hypothetical protein
MPYFVSPRRPIARGLIALLTMVCLSQLARESAAGTVVIGDQSRGVQWKFGGDEPFASSNSQSSPTPQPFDTTVDETDTGGGGSGSARVAATYESVLSASLSEASGDLFVERAGRPAAANAAFIFEFGVNDGLVDVALALDAMYRRTAGAPDPIAATGELRLSRIIVGAPPGSGGEVVLDHAFALGAADDQTETFRRGEDGGDPLRLGPGAYALAFHIGLPEGPPNFSDWNVDGTSTDRSDGVTFNITARFTSASGGGGGTPVIPLPPAALSGSTLLAAMAVYRRVRSGRRTV